MTADRQPQLPYLPPVSWINQVMIPDYSKLEPGWDGYGGIATTAEAIKTARLMALIPGSDGGLQYEINAGGWEIEISIAPDGEIIDVYCQRKKSP